MLTLTSEWPKRLVSPAGAVAMSDAAINLSDRKSCISGLQLVSTASQLDTQRCRMLSINISLAIRKNG